ncbi:MAG TPA: hypothetical protein VGF53_10945 [Pseudolabrys sp.]|jgi:hypothetical protein
MSTQSYNVRYDRPIHDGLHPLVYRSMVALTIWLVLSVWAFFSTGAYIGLTLAMVTLFFVVLVAIPVIIWKTWQHNALPEETREPAESFDAWASQRFATSTGALSGREAAMQILLPIAAVSIGMTIFGLVFYFDVPHGGY